MRAFATLAVALGALASTVAGLDPITVQEQEFIDTKTGDRFVIVGVDYQPGGQSAAGTGAGDPLSHPPACLRDAALMQDLGVNTIRCYNVDPTADHDECVSIFNTVGIYILIDVNTPIAGQYINRDNPSSTYTLGYLKHVFSVIEAFKSYENVLGFFAGNEIINTVSNGKTCPPYIRAVQRDMKNYIKNNAARQIPVGYSAADVESLYADTWAYLQCEIGGTTDESRSDFFGLNDYSWCGNASSYTISGYNVLVETFGDTTIPVFFSEYGCNVPEPRYFDEVPVLYGPRMTVLSGGLVYQWTQDVSDYGLVQIESNGGAKLLGDYDTLQGKYDEISISLLTKSNNSATSLKPPTCNANLISGSFSTDFNIPDPPSGAQALIDNGIPNPPSGKLIAVTATSVTVPVYQTGDVKVTDLHIVTGATNANYPGKESPVATAASDSSLSSHADEGGLSGSSSSHHSSSGSSSGAPVVASGILKSALAAAALGVVALAL